MRAPINIQAKSPYSGTIEDMEFLFWLDEYLVAIFAALFGMVFASFCCVVVERVPKGLSINGRSECVCGRELKASENIPILGWLLSGGKAKCCGAKIPAHYFFAEVAGAVSWAALVIFLGPLWGFISAGILTAIVTTAAVFLRKKKLADQAVS